MRETVAILVGSALIASALVFHAYQRRYEGALANDGLFVRLDSRTGKLSACILVDGSSSMETVTIIGNITKKLRDGGFGDKEVDEWLTSQWGQMVCSPWND
jgi:hypothetical protein